MRAEDKRLMMEKSRSRTKHWPNTIENMRVKRIEDRYRALEDAELERRRIDEEEESFNQAKRQAALEHAAKKMHDGQDKVKAFHTKMLMCDVLQERDAQIELKKRRKEQERAVEEGWVENDKVKMDDYDKRMLERMEEMYKRKHDTAKIIKDQLHNTKITRIK